MGRWSRSPAKRSWIGSRPAGHRWLDVGCGNGAFTEELIARVPRAVTAIDPSEAQLAYARTRPGVRTADFAWAMPAQPFADDSSMLPSWRS